MTGGNKYSMDVTCIRDTNAYDGGLPCRTDPGEAEGSDEDEDE